MNRREMLRRLAIGASGLVVAESVRDFMAWEAKRIFALGGVPTGDTFDHGVYLEYMDEGMIYWRHYIPDQFVKQHGRDGAYRMDVRIPKELQHLSSRYETTLWVPTGGFDPNRELFARAT